MQLNKFGLLLISALAFAMVGCSSSSPAEPLTGSGGETTSGGTTAATGENPGVVRMPILAELTTINLSDLGGHVVYAGPDQAFFEGYSYVNLDFACDGTGTFELFPSAETASFQPIFRGTTVWTVSADGEDVDVDIIDTTEGDGGPTDFDATSIFVNPDSVGTLIVGRSTLQNKVVANILQYEECG